MDYFFLVGVIETGKNSIHVFEEILKLQKELDTRILTLGRKAKQAKLLLDILYKKPILDASEIAELLAVSKPTAYNLIKNFVQLEILEEMTGWQRNKKFAFSRYIELFSMTENV